MKYPLELSVRALDPAPQVSVVDAEGRFVLYLKDKFYKLREAVTIFADSAQSRPVFRIDADQMLDLSASYSIRTTQGEPLGGLQQRGIQSIWRAHYDIVEGERVVMTIREENPWAKMADSVLGAVPLIGLVSGYLFHPTYRITRPDGTLVFRARKEAALKKGLFRITNESEASTWEESLGLLGLLMMVLLERGRA